MKTFIFLIWKKFKKFIIALVILAILTLLLALIIYTLPQQISSLIIKGWRNLWGVFIASPWTSQTVSGFWSSWRLTEVIFSLISVEPISKTHDLICLHWLHYITQHPRLFKHNLGHQSNNQGSVLLSNSPSPQEITGHLSLQIEVTYLYCVN